MPPITFDTALRTALGGKSAADLERDLGLSTVGALLRHYPRRYAERGELSDLASLRVGEDVTVIAEIQRVNLRTLRSKPGERRKRTLLDVVIGDGRATLLLTFFNQHWKADKLRAGQRGLFAGKISEFNGRRQLNQADMELFDEPEENVEAFLQRPIPFYPLAAKLRMWRVRRCVEHALQVVDFGEDPIPPEVRERHGLIGFEEAIRQIHMPANRAEIAAARKRLKWEEALAVQLALAQRRHAAAARPATARPRRDGGALAAFDGRLPFTLTAGQREIGETIAAELAGEHPMYRLLQGEVGSGKTVIALRAMLQVVDQGGQAALLAPTEVLAAQHARSLEELLGPLAHAGELDGHEAATRVALLTGSQSASERRTSAAAIAGGEAGVVVGTHALIQETVEFSDLGLVVVDEQHRFGVEQRDALRGKGIQPPHLLVMTATPIPRTVAMTVFGDLSISALRELPAGRSPISSSVVPLVEHPVWIDRVWQRIREEVEQGHRAYVVCPRIGGDESSEDVDEREEGEEERRPPMAVVDVAPMLAEGPLAGLRVGVLHGRLPADEKDDVMRDFGAGKLDVLVATTVIEVGVDVPEATVMVVLDAERFGVSQLHQLRGRVGRGSAPGLCLLVSESPPGTPARERLDAVAGTLDGFELARVDLEQRREGDVLGAAQSGRRSQLRMLSLLRDEELIEEARRDATELVAADPTLSNRPALASLVATYADTERADYLEKA